MAPRSESLSSFLRRVAAIAGLMSLIDFMQATTAARHDIHDWPFEHPDSLLPGSPVAPSCP